MKNLIRSLVLVSFTIILNLAYAQNSKDWKLSPDGFGPIHIGMTLEEAAKVTGKTFTNVKPDPSYEDESCFYTMLKDKSLESVSFMISHGKIVRIDIRSSRFATPEGARIGDTETQVKALYKGKKIKVERHHYTEGHYLTYMQNGRGIRFETDGKKVTMMYGGRNQEIQYVEGCV